MKYTRCPRCGSYTYHVSQDYIQCTQCNLLTNIVKAQRESLLYSSFSENSEILAGFIIDGHTMTIIETLNKNSHLDLSSFYNVIQSLRNIQCEHLSIQLKKNLVLMVFPIPSRGWYLVLLVTRYGISMLEAKKLVKELSLKNKEREPTG